MVVSLSRMIVTLITCVLTSGLLAAGDPHTNDSLHDSLVTAYLLEYAPGGVILDQLDELVRDAPLLLAHVPRLIRVLDSLVTACMTA